MLGFPLALELPDNLQDEAIKSCERISGSSSLQCIKEIFLDILDKYC